MTDSVREALEDALHALTTLNGITGSDGLSSYGDALELGCDNNGAWDSFVAQTFQIDNAPTIARLRAVLGSDVQHEGKQG